MGKEARAKRLRQVAMANGMGATYQFHITDREGFALITHCLNAAPQRDHGAQLRLYRMFEELGLRDAVDMCLTTDRLGIKDFDSVQAEVVTTSRGTVDIVLELTNRDMPGALAMVLTPLILRLKDVQAGTYTLPPELANEAQEAAGAVS